MTEIAPVIVWFRQDLRLSDNPALSEACQRGPILPIYILDDQNAGKWALGSASRVWLHHSLNSLNRSLNNKMLFFRGDAGELLPKIAQQFSARAVHWNRCYEPWRIKRDSILKQQLEKQSIEVKSFNASLLKEPWKNTKKDDTPFRVFTPFYKQHYLNATPLPSPLSAPSRLDVFETGANSNRNAHQFVTPNSLNDLKLLPKHNWHQHMSSHWQFGERAADMVLENFLEQGLNGYQKARDIPSQQGVSRLSPYLQFGEISPLQVWHRASSPMAKNAPVSDQEHFLRELVWREFCHHLLFHFPTFPEKNFQPKFDNFPWKKNARALKLWQQGKTGYPIVDAGMRELWETGYMHNRVRMIVASFLVKNQLIHWREGEKWFWDCLVDASLASNSANWQWVAGSGADAAPYFRIFNPLTQGQKFDPQGHYIRRYIRELKDTPSKLIHKPDDLANHPPLIDQAGHYPKPILDLKETRTRALEAYNSIKLSNGSR